MRIRPSRQTRHNVKLLKELGHDEVRIGGCGQLVNFCDDADQRRFHPFDGLRGEIIPLLLKAPMVFLKFFAVEID